MTATKPRTAWLFILPAALFYAAFVAWPVVHSILLSIFSGCRVPGAHFARLLAPDPWFLRALGNNVLLVILSLVIQLPAALGIALLLSGKVRGRGLLRTVYFAPMILPAAAVGALWKAIYAPIGLRGLLNSLLAAFGLDTVDWLGQAETDLFAIVITVSWRYIGFHAVLFMAGLESIPAELYEAARVDGASAWQSFREVTLPLLRRVIAISATLSIVGSLKYFDIFYTMSPEGGTNGSADLVTTWMWRTAFRDGEPGYASAIAVALLVVTLAIALPAARILHGRRNE